MERLTIIPSSAAATQEGLDEAVTPRATIAPGTQRTFGEIVQISDGDTWHNGKRGETQTTPVAIGAAWYIFNGTKWDRRVLRSGD